MKKKIHLSVVLATFNEESNIATCLSSIKNIADEIIVIDGSSTDKTREISESFGARVVKVENHPIFHINKQKALEEATGEWILQLDADEIVSSELADEISKIIQMTNSQIDEYESTIKNMKLFTRHKALLENRDGKIGNESPEYIAFFVPRSNFFLGKYLRWGGVYPDGVIRLVKNGKAFFPAKDVHEQIVVEGRVGWLQNDLIHMDSPTFKRYLERNSRYIDLIVNEMNKDKLPKNFTNGFNYFVYKPIHWFLMTSIRHKGILDGFQGIIFSLFSSLRFPRAYWRYLSK